MVAATPPNAASSPRQPALVVREHEVEIAGFCLQVSAGEARGRSIVAEGAELTVGSAEGNHLVLADPSVARYHCVITATPDGFVLRDLGSTSGTTLGGYRVREAVLTPGASVCIGSAELVFDTTGRTLRQPLGRAQSFHRVLGESAAMRRAFAALERAAPHDMTVLLLGESGTGKSLVAQAIHARSTRAGGPFVAVDCAAIPPGRLESELFGHDPGAFPGADERRIGQLETANGGTIYLGEIGELSPDLQLKLLRVMDKRVLRRVGSLEPISVDVRLIASASRDLRLDVNRGAFRADLYYALDVASVTLPSLRERREDIPALVAGFWAERAGAGAEPPAHLLGVLARQDWPGNVRQLRAAVERAIAVEEGVQGPVPLDLPVAAGSAPISRARSSPPASEVSGAFDPTQSFRAAKEAVVSRWERAYLAELVRHCRGNVSRAARAARMDRNHLRDLLRRHGIDSVSDPAEAEE